MQQPAESLGSISEMAVGIKIVREVRMKAGNRTETGNVIVKLNASLGLKFRIIVTAVVGCLLAVPLPRDYKR